ncbi:MAG TPA: NAD(+)/NADH kinase [Dehalococcoidia bacterium]|nr:NAD(+)/NADH kinase [Dehalococcoidia bacterium]
MARVGIIANPASGKDIRRLVAHGSVFDNSEKVNIIRRAMVSLAWFDIDEVIGMPDYYGLLERAAEGIKSCPPTRTLDMPVIGSAEDSRRAAELMVEAGVDAIITLGGDGTNRAVAKGSGDVPLIPISTGTNNVFPRLIEGTTAGIAAGLVATGQVDRDVATFRAKRLEVFVDGDLRDIALIDAVVSIEWFVASRAIWDLKKVRDVVLTQAEPGAMGLSALGASLRPVARRDPFGLYLRVGEGPWEIMAPIGPGLLGTAQVSEPRDIPLGTPIAIEPIRGTIALDGEREIELSEDRRAAIRISAEGPRVVDIDQALIEAARQGTFRKKSSE